MEKIIIIAYGIIVISHIIVDTMINREKDRLRDSIMDFNTKLIRQNSDLMMKLSSVEYAIFEAETKKKTYRETVEDIKKELSEETTQVNSENFKKPLDLL
jgi:sugar-specific transcriptional regulator TrmB